MIQQANKWGTTTMSSAQVFFCCFQSFSDFEQVSVDEAGYLVFSLTYDLRNQWSDVAIKCDKVTASLMRMNASHISFLCSLHLELWLHRHVTKGQCLLSRCAFGVETSEWCTSFKNDIKIRTLKKCSYSIAADKWHKGDQLNFNRGHLPGLECIDASNIGLIFNMYYNSNISDNI